MTSEDTKPSDVDVVVDDQVSTEDKKGSGRVQLSSIINCELSTSRLRKNLTDNGLNLTVNKYLDEFVDLKDDKKVVLRPAVQTYDQLSEECRACLLSDLPPPVSQERLSKMSPEDSAFARNVELLRSGDRLQLSAVDQPSLLKTAMQLVKSHQVRNSDGATVAFTATMNYIVSRLAEFGCAQLRTEGKKTLKPHHMVGPEVEQTDVWPFLRDLKCIQDVREAHVRFLGEQDRLRAERAQKRKDKKADAESGAEPVKADKKDKLPKQPWSEFEHHTALIFRQVTKSGEDKLEMSADVKNFGARLVFELCEAYVRKIRKLVKYSGVKTIKPDTIECATDLFLDRVEVSPIHAYVADRLTLFANHKSQKKDVSKTVPDTVMPVPLP